MTSKITILTLLLITTLFSCKQKSTFSNFKYADKPAVFICENTNSKLLNEALYSFEDDILNYYKKGNTKTRLDQAYSQTIRNSIFGRFKFEDVISKHTVAIFEALKNENNLWDQENPKSKLNYNSAIFNCIGDNLKNQKLKTTLNALISTNSMSPKLFGRALVKNYRNALSDKNLAMYIALDLYYANLFNIDFSKINLEKPQEDVNFNVTPKLAPASPAPVDSHAGHNH